MRKSKILQAVIALCLVICCASTAVAADLNSFFSNPTFGFPPLLQNAKFGMSEAEIQRAVPNFQGDNNFKVKGNEGIQVEKDMSFGSLYSIRINLASQFKEVASFLQQKWGKAIAEKDLTGATEYHWLSRDKGIRAKLAKFGDEMQLSYFQYLPFETLFPGNIPTLPTPLKGIRIGSSKAQLFQTIPAFKQDEGANWTDLKGYLDVRIWYFLRNKSIIRHFSVSFPTIENVRNILIQKWGTPLKSSTGKEYWRNNELEYIDEKGGIQKGIFIVYRSEPPGFNHGIDFTPKLENYEYE